MSPEEALDAAFLRCLTDAVPDHETGATLLTAIKDAGWSVVKVAEVNRVESDVAGQYINVPEGIEDGTPVYVITDGSVVPTPEKL